MNDLLRRMHDTYDILFMSHQAQLSSLYRCIHQRLNEEAAKEDVNLILDKILDEAKLYFKSEEEFLSLLLYDSVAQHAVEHNQLLSALKAFQNQYANGSLILLKISDLVDVIQARIDSHRTEMLRVLESCMKENDQFLGDFSDGKELHVSVSVFDVQHRNLDFIIDQLQQKIADDKVHQDVATLLMELSEKLSLHFNQEELLMKRYKFPLLDEHKKDHDFFLQKFTDYRASYKKGNIDLKTFLQLRDEINEHILDYDKKYSDFFNELGLS